MATVDQYRSKIAGVVAKLPRDGDTYTLETKAQARLIIRELTGYQKELRLIKGAITQDIKLLQAEYRAGTRSAQNTGAGLGLLFEKRRMGGTISANMKRGAAAKRDAQVEPYDAVRRDIDALILGIDSVKLQVERGIAQM